MHPRLEEEEEHRTCFPRVTGYPSAVAGPRVLHGTVPIVNNHGARERTACKPIGAASRTAALLVIDAGILGEPLVEPDLTGSHQLAEEPEHQASFRNAGPPVDSTRKPECGGDGGVM